MTNEDKSFENEVGRQFNSLMLLTSFDETKGNERN
jgi:hypothetical protein